MYVLVFQGSVLNVLVSKADTEQRQTVRQDSLWFKMSFLTNITEVVCLLKVAMAILQPGTLASCAERVKFLAVKRM